ncbi:MAG: hypothetical protein AB7V55_00930 [Oscillospiraceae bacterium]
MTKLENSLLDSFRKYVPWVFIIAAVAVAVAVRCLLVPIVSSDMRLFLLPWYEEMVANGGGYESVFLSRGNYNTAYLSLIWLATKLPMQPIAAIKLFSFLGDALLAWAAALIARQLLVAKRWRNLYTALAFCGVLLLPTVVLNSAYWGQCDAIYSAFLLFAVWCALRQRYIFTFVFAGLALAFKLQAIFLLPALIILYVCKRRFSILHFLVPPAILVLSTAPDIIYHGDILAPFRVYAGQVTIGDGAYVNYHNLGAVFGKFGDTTFSVPLILLFFLVCLGMLAIVLVRRLDFSGDGLLLLCGWSVMACVVLLPSMHERYAFAGEILLLLWAVLRPSVRRLAPAVTFYLIGLMACCRFVLGQLWPGQNIWLGLLNAACFAVISTLLLHDAARARPTK